MPRIVHGMATPALLCAALLAAGGQWRIHAAAPAEQAWVAGIESLPSPAGANSAEPQLTVEGTRAILSWVETAGRRATVKFAERTPQGWTAPRLVVSSPTLMVNPSDVPSVHALPNGTLVAAWHQTNGPNPEVYNLRLATSKNGGRTWSRPFSPHHDRTNTQHGFLSLFPLTQASSGKASGGGYGLIWLDGRTTNPDIEEGPEAGEMAVRGTTFGPTGKQGPDVLIDGRVCECCPTSAAVTADGPIVAYRGRSTKEIRDIHVARMTGGTWSKPTLVHDDGWRIQGCPVNGPSIRALGHDVAVGWFTEQRGEGHAFLAFSHDSGRTFGPPIRVDDVGSIGRVGVTLLSATAAAVSWVEYANDRSQFKVRRVVENGDRSAAVFVADSPGTRIPRLARVGDELLLAWSEASAGASRVHTARLALPK